MMVVRTRACPHFLTAVEVGGIAGFDYDDDAVVCFVTVADGAEEEGVGFVGW